MLTKILLHLKPTFARTFKPKKSIMPSNTEPTAPKILQSSTEQNESQYINKELRQKQRKLKEKVKAMVESNLKEEEILRNFIKEQKGDSWKQYDADMVRQQMVLNQIVEKYGKAKKELPIGSKYQEKPIDEEEKFQREKRILQRIRESQRETEGINEGSFQDKLRVSYPQNAIKEAQRMRNEEYKYFKELTSSNYIKEHEKPKKQDIMDRRLKKNESYAGLIERDQAQNQLINMQKKQRNEKLKLYKELQVQYRSQRQAKSQELVQYEDENYYKEKGLKQFQTRQMNKNVDKELLEAGEKDMEKSDDVYGIMIDQYQENHFGSEQRKEIYEQSSFGKMDAKMRELESKLIKHGIQFDVQELRGMKKQMLFSQKKQREELQQYRKYLLKKEKKTKAKEFFNKIHEEKLRDDLDFQNDFKNRFKDFKYDPLDIQGNMAKVKQIELQRKALLLNKDVKSQLHFKKTEKNLTNFIRSCFYENLLQANQNLYCKIEITALKFNQKKTVANVFWVFEDSADQKDEEMIRKMEKRLKESGKFISGKMTQYLGLRYGPDIRFYYDKILPETIQIKQSLEQTKSQVIEYELKNLMEKGYIKTPKEAQEAREKLKVIADQNILNYHNRDKLLSKKFQKAQRNTKQTPNRKKKTADERLWQHIDKL